MLNTWNEFCQQINISDGKIAEFIESSGLSSLQLKKLQKFTCEWNKTKKLAEVFDRYVMPIDPIKVESPFDQEDFRYVWKMWKEYLIEQHGIFMKSRAEQSSLDYLAEISENNPDVAINYIRFAMKGPFYKGFLSTIVEI